MTMHSSPYLAQMAFSQAARKTPEPGRLLISIILIEFLYTVLRDLLSVFIVKISPTFSDVYETGLTVPGLLLQLCSFGLLTLVLVAIVHRRHHRGLLSLTGRLDLAVPQMLRVLAFCLIAFGVIEMLPPWWSSQLLAHTRSLPFWLLLLPVSLLALLIQTSAEELFYRGFIQQQLAARFAQPWVWMIVPNVIFALAHWENGSTLAESVQYFVWAFGFGLAASDLTARSGNIGPAVGFHLANNAYAFLLYSTVGYPDSALALFLFADNPVWSGPAPDNVIPLFDLPFLLDMGSIFVLWLTARLAIAR